jgi:hypothetical protein
MTKVIHKELLATGRWFGLSLAEQMANIGCDVGRCLQWRAKGDVSASQQAFNRVLELIDFTVLDPKNRSRLREILRVRECFADYIVGANQYGFTDAAWNSYFYYFAYLVAAQRGK